MEILLERQFQYPYDISKSIQFIRKNFKKRSEVKVATCENGVPIYTHTKYHFNNLPFYEHKYLSWENLNCCGGWPYDETYLYTAVQKDKKLVAGVTLHKGTPDMKYDELLALIQKEKENPDINYNALLTQKTNEWKVDAATTNSYIEKEQYSQFCIRLIIIKKGCLNDFYDLDEILEAYRKQDIILTPQGLSILKNYFNIELSDLFYEGVNNFKYTRLHNSLEAIVCGLGLGYPIESTASLIKKK